MKKLIQLVSVVLIITLTISFSNSNHLIYPNEILQKQLLEKNEEFKKQIEHFITRIEQDKKESYVDAYKSVRRSYKSMETYIVYRYPGIDKAINGGPVPGITTDVVILHKDNPTGLQVLEELLSANKVSNKALLKELKFMQKNARLIEQSLTGLPIQNWEILDANHMAITKLITLGLSGFDSPEFLLSISDGVVVLKQVKADLLNFKPLVTKSFSYPHFNEQLSEAIRILEQTTDFDSLNRYTFYRDYLLPIQAEIKALHTNTNYETYKEVSNIKRSVGEGAHLFSEEYLNPFYSFRGNVITPNQDQVKLGELLFFDPVLSGNNKRACASCHSPNKAFADGVAKSVSNKPQGTVVRNAPTLINSCFQDNFFWDLRSSDMNDQILNVILGEDEFNTTPTEIVTKLKQSNTYTELFKNAYYAFDEPINIGTIKTSLELYIRSLVNLNAKFDRNIRGEENTFTNDEEMGANLFFGKAACATCHFPPNFNGFVPPHYNDTEGEILGTTASESFKEMDTDYGMYERFKFSYPNAMYTKGMFKTPTLRNIELTAPYMHNGQFTSLETVLEFYNNGGGAGMGIHVPQQTLASDSLLLSDKEKAQIIAFMKTLTDTSGTYTQPFLLPTFADKALNNRKWGGEY